MSMENPLTPAGIESATFRFVAQHLNHCATAVPTYMNITAKHKSMMQCLQRFRHLEPEQIRGIYVTREWCNKCERRV